MNNLKFIPFLFLFIACANEENTEGEITGNLMEVLPEQVELDEIALIEQPQIIQDFFAIGKDIIGTNYCYDYTGISQLILYGNDSLGVWSKFEVSNNYLTIYQPECEVLLEFMTFEWNGKKKAFLSQMNKGSQQFNFLNWNNDKEKWLKKTNFPKPVFVDFFEDLTELEKATVTDFGGYFIYINPEKNSATYVFSQWNMAMNMGEKQVMEFDKKPNYDFELSTIGNRFTLSPVQITLPPTKTDKFLVGYTNGDKPSLEFEMKYKAIIEELNTPDFTSIHTKVGANDYTVFFPKDTFNLNFMEQFEPRDGFWLYKRGEEPLDLGADLPLEEILYLSKEYFNGVIL